MIEKCGTVHSLQRIKLNIRKKFCLSKIGNYFRVTISENLKFSNV